MNTFNYLEKQLSGLKKAGLHRSLRCIESAQGTIVRFSGADSGEKVLFCSNNYLSLASDKRISAAISAAVSQYGSGAVASRMISGTMKPHVEVELAFADFFGKESSLLLPSGWSANEALLRTIPQKGDIVLMDKLDHASIIDAAKSCQASFHTYRRGNLAKLEKYLALPDFNRKFIVTESVFSMDGDTADLKTLIELKKKYGAILIVDEAHAVGCMGKTGAGFAEQLGLLRQVDIIVAPLGKAFAATGAIVAASRVVTDYLINTARPFIYTTAPSPPNCAAILAALEIVKTEPQRRAGLSVNADLLRMKLTAAGFDIAASSTHIVPVILGSAKKAVQVSKKLFDAGFFVAAIRPPTVPKGTARLRVSLQSDHTNDQIESLIDVLKQII